jgi:hypothetical protein
MNYKLKNQNRIKYVLSGQETSVLSVQVLENGFYAQTTIVLLLTWQEEELKYSLLSLNAFNSCRTLFYQDSVSAVRAPYACVLVVNFHFLFTASALISHTTSRT